MKYRSGFVSNSSSSSFIIACDKEPALGIQDLSVPLSQLTESSVVVISTLEELQKYICEDHDYLPKEDRTPEKMAEHCEDTYWYEEAKQAIEDGHKLYRYWVDNCDQTAMNIMNHFEVVYGD